MKKLLLAVVAALMATVNLNAQYKGDWTIGGHIGLNTSTVTNNDDAKLKTGWGAEFDLNYYLTDRLTVGVVGGRDFIGYKSKIADKKVSMNYLNLGPAVKYYVKPWIAIHAGTQLGYLMSAKMDGENVKGNFKKTELSLPIGCSLEPSIGGDKRLVIDLRYRLGMSRVNKHGDSMHNSSLMLTVGLSTVL